MQRIDWITAFHASSHIMMSLSDFESCLRYKRLHMLREVVKVSRKSQKIDIWCGIAMSYSYQIMMCSTSEPAMQLLFPDEVFGVKSQN